MPVEASQTLTSPSAAPEASAVPSGDQATAYTLPVWPVRVLISTPAEASQILIVASSPAVAIWLWSGDQLAERTAPRCPRNCCSTVQQSTSHSCAPATPELTTSLPSGE